MDHEEIDSALLDAIDEIDRLETLNLWEVDLDLLNEEEYPR